MKKTKGWPTKQNESQNETQNTTLINRQTFFEPLIHNSQFEQTREVNEHTSCDTTVATLEPTRNS